jgi:hypothetical protein
MDDGGAADRVDVVAFGFVCFFVTLGGGGIGMRQS